MKQNEITGLVIILAVMVMVCTVVYGLSNIAGYTEGYNDASSGKKNKMEYSPPYPGGYDSEGLYNNEIHKKDYTDLIEDYLVPDKKLEGGKENDKQIGTEYKNPRDRDNKIERKTATYLQSNNTRKKKLSENLQGVGRFLQNGWSIIALIG